MGVLKKIVRKIVKNITQYISEPKAPNLFYTKDIFADKKFKIGDYTYGKPTVVFENNDANLIIGKFCSIADHVTIFLGGNHRTDWITTYPFSEITNEFPEAVHIKGHPATKGNVTIGNDVWIGRGAVIMSGVSIGNGAIVAAGALISKDIGNFEIWGGNPGRLLKKRFDENQISKLNDLRWWDWEIDKIKKELDFLCSDKI
jgi:acetyltransferase-like isoleucine patch superfamily enzyme